MDIRLTHWGMLALIAGLLLGQPACKKEANSANPPMQTEIVGVGLQLRAGQDGQPVMVMGVVPDSPAAKAGLKQGFVVLAIDDKATCTQTLAECVSSIRGKAGTQVRLQIVDVGAAQTNDITLTRKKIVLK